MNHTFVSRIKLVVAALWAFVVMWFFVRSFPFRNLLEVILNGWMLVILLFFFTALGTRIFRYLNLSFPSLAQEWSFAFGIGSGLTIFLMIGLAALQILYELVVVCLIIFLFILVYQDVRSLGLRVYSLFRVVSSKRWPFVDLGLLFLIGLAGIATFFAAATPPFFYDALVYHLAVPQQYFLAHGFRDMPYHHFSNFPMNLGMLFMVGMSFSGGMLAKLISWSFAPMTAVAAYGFVKPRWGRRMALLAATILFLVPGVLALSTLTSVDLGVMFYSFLSFSALLSWFTSRQKSWFILSGIFCGLAVGTKYTAVLMTFGTIIIVLVSHDYLFAKRRRFFLTLRSIALFSIIVLCIVSPWFVKNIVYTGNPVYPFLHSVFNTHAAEFPNYDSAISRKSPVFVLFRSLLVRETRDLHYWLNTVATYIESPWTFTMKSTRAAGKTGVLFLLVLPGVFLIKKIDSTIWYLLGSAGCIFFLWQIFLPGEALRYIFQMFPLLSIVAAYLLWHLSGVPKRRTWIVSGISFILGYHLIIFFGETALLRPFDYVFGKQTEAEFLAGHGANYDPVFQYINAHTPPESLILFVGEIRSYRCEREFLLSTNEPDDANAILLRNLIQETQDINDLLRELQHMKVTHILVNWAEMQRFAARKGLSVSEYLDFQTETEGDIFQRLFFPPYTHSIISEYDVTLYEIQ